MVSSCFSISHLETLSTNELIELADECSLDIPHDLERIFIIEELFEYGQENNIIADEEKNSDGIEFKELSALPKHYNISYIDTLIRDPLWVFVFWEINDHDKEIYKKSRDFNGFCLNVKPLKQENFQPESSVPSFNIIISENDNAQYLGFPPDTGRCNRIELCAMLGEANFALAVSRPFIMPKLIEPWRETPLSAALQSSFLQDIYCNPLAKLSGADRYILTRSVDRLSRNSNSSADTGKKDD